MDMHVLRSRTHQFARVGLFAVLTIMLLLEGGNPWIVAQAGAVAVGVFLLLAVPEPPRNTELARLRLQTGIFVLLIILYVGFQIVPLQDYGNSVWDGLESMLGVTGQGSISVAPGQAGWALLRMLLPYGVFLAGLCLVQFEVEAVWLWRAFAVLGFVFAAYGILQLVFFPDWLLFREKTAYFGSFTSVLVNRNNAATFLGMSIVASFCVLRWENRSGLRDGFWQEPWIHFAGFGMSRCAVALVFSIIVQFLALGLTTSRGGLAATVVALLFVVVLLGFKTMKGSGWQRVFLFLAFAGLLLFAVELTSGRTMTRMLVAGADARICIFGASLQAALANLPFGTGLGSFEDVYATVHWPECAIVGRVDKAHNSYLENFLELGVPYFVFLGIAILVLARVFFKGYRDRQEYRPFVVGGVGLTLVVGLHALVDFSLQIPVIACFYAFLLSGSVAMALGRAR